MAAWRTVDVPLEAVAGAGWRALNSVDLQIVALRTAWTFVATSRACGLPRDVAEAISNIVANTIAERRGVKHSRHWNLLMPPSEGADPDDFPVDPLGVAVWPWRQQILAAGWEAEIAEKPSFIGPVLLLGVFPKRGADGAQRQHDCRANRGAEQ
ncbi:hypothetical protein [Caenispirillum salinarum]|uniref:hypothetical protein n=1 Tax=Caenispirillum salinarum TaxID=859058 RepID=UPI0005BCAE9D|nr:hypothetical protein [Caenispirillum salinarum]